MAADGGSLSTQLPDVMKWFFSAASFLMTAYFWLVRVNREKVSLGVYPVVGFEGRLEPGGIGCWTGKIFLCNRSIVPTAVVEIEAELYWKGRWRSGACHCGDGSELPWNMPPAQAYAKTLTAAFDVGADTPLNKVYAQRKIRLTFITVEGTRATHQLRTTGEKAAAA